MAEADSALRSWVDTPASRTLTEPRAVVRGWCYHRGGQRIIAIRARLGAQSSAALLATCEAATLPYARVSRPDDLLADPHLLASGGLLPTSLSTLGDGSNIVGLPAVPMEFGDNRARPGLHTQPPAIGADTASLLRDAGYTDAAITALHQAGIIALPTP